MTTFLAIRLKMCFGCSKEPSHGAVSSGSTLFASILNLSVMLGNYLQQTTSADNIFRCIFFLGALQVKKSSENDQMRFDMKPFRKRTVGT